MSPAASNKTTDTAAETPGTGDARSPSGTTGTSPRAKTAAAKSTATKKTVAAKKTTAAKSTAAKSTAPKSATAAASTKSTAGRSTATRTAASKPPAAPKAAGRKKAAAPADKDALAVAGEPEEDVVVTDDADIETALTDEAGVIEPDVDEDADAEEEAAPEDAPAVPSPKDEKTSGFVITNNDDDDAPAQQVVSAGATADPVKDYLKQIGKVALLNAEQEVELAKRIEAGLFAEERLNSGTKLEPKMRRELEWIAGDGRRAKNHLLEANLRLVVSLAKRYTGRGMLFLDLIQEGNLGLDRKSVV